MGDRPFRCSKCGNWYIGIPVEAGAVCRVCFEGSHARNPKTGEYDCHFGQTSPTPSEIKMAQLLASSQALEQAAQNAVGSIEASKDRGEVKVIMSRLEQSFAQAELAQAEIPEILRWAVVMELPGMTDSPAAARFKHIDAIRELVGSNRRPPEDLAMLERSDRTCREIASEIPGLLSNARMSLGQARQAAQAWTEKPTASDLMAKARAAKKEKALVHA